MPTNIFVNLPVKDLDKSIEFFKKLGFKINPQFTDETAACVVITNNIYAMILTEPKFKGFIKKQIADSTKTTEVMVALSVDSKEKVDDMFKKALKAGGKAARKSYDYEFMYGQAFEDLDGHIWEVFWIDLKHKHETNK